MSSRSFLTSDSRNMCHRQRSVGSAQWSCGCSGSSDLRYFWSLLMFSLSISFACVFLPPAPVCRCLSIACPPASAPSSCRSTVCGRCSTVARPTSSQKPLGSYTKRKRSSRKRCCKTKQPLENGHEAPSWRAFPSIFFSSCHTPPSIEAIFCPLSSLVLLLDCVLVGAQVGRKAFAQIALRSLWISRSSAKKSHAFSIFRLLS